MAEYYVKPIRPQPEGEYWKAFGQGLTFDINEAHIYSEFELEKYGIRRLDFVMLVAASGEVGIDVT